MSDGSVRVALDVGTVVLPYRWADGSAAEHARAHDAALAVPRGRAAPGQVSLSPLSLRVGTPPRRVVLPSPNGATLAFTAGRLGLPCVAACLRNASAISGWIAGSGASRVAVVAAGELDGHGLRPAAEDLWGAGAVVAALVTRGRTSLSPEAELAAAAYAVVSGREAEMLRACASGRELVDGGSPGDVDVAAAVDTSASMPVLVDGCFVDEDGDSG